jgi:hypothetical protein
MYAIVYSARIDLYLGNTLSEERLELLLDDLKAEHVPSLMPHGRRSVTAVDSAGRMITFVQRTSNLTDSEIADILNRQGISVADQASA